MPPKVVPGTIFLEIGGTLYFDDSTMFIIAHRVQTVLHCDKILALKFGEIVEFDTPEILKNKEGGYFADIYNRMLEM